MVLIATTRKRLPMQKKYRKRLPAMPVAVSSAYSDQETGLHFRLAWSWLDRQSRLRKKKVWLHLGSGAMCTGPKGAFRGQDAERTMLLAGHSKAASPTGPEALFSLFSRVVRPAFPIEAGQMLAPSVGVKAPLSVSHTQASQMADMQKDDALGGSFQDVEDEDKDADEGSPQDRTCNQGAGKTTGIVASHKEKTWPTDLLADVSAFRLYESAQVSKLKTFMPPAQEKPIRRKKKTSRRWPMIPGTCYIL